MKIGYVQFAPVLEKPDQTIASLEPMLERARDADLLVLPELCNSGYNFPSKESALKLAEPIDRSPFLDFLHSKCRALDMYVATGFNERDGATLFNAAVLMGPHGCVGVYRKLHLFMNEKDIFEPGNVGLPVFDGGPVKVGMAVCFDWMFPEVFRVLALNGADIICHPANLVLPGLAQQAIPVHGLLNRVYMVTANRIGQEGDLTFTGNSLISTPRGEILSSAPADEPRVDVVDVDIETARDKTITARNHAFGDRRPDQYGPLTD